MAFLNSEISNARLRAIVDIPGEPEDPVKAIKFFLLLYLVKLEGETSGLRSASRARALISSGVRDMCDEIFKRALCSEITMAQSRELRPNSSSTTKRDLCSPPAVLAR